ncbi:MAG TPA: glycerophosphodiester phosphodiesterase family protein [bacterium]|nr:glycerophosphodiester phosphodiesterase family protein [bacterium]
MLFIAHRGASYDAPENTLASINLAWKVNAKAVEIDVYLTADENIVAIHDKTAERTGGKDLLIREQTLDALRQLDFGRHKGEQWAGERIPTFPEILATVPEDGKMFVEIKCGSEIIFKLRECVQRSGLRTDQIVYICFDLPTLEAVKRALPEHLCYWLRSIKKNPETGVWEPDVESMIEGASKAGLDGLDVQAREIVDSSFVKKVRGAGMGIYVWTVNEIPLAQAMVEAGVDGITTDRPHWLRESLGL